MSCCNSNSYVCDFFFLIKRKAILIRAVAQGAHRGGGAPSLGTPKARGGGCEHRWSCGLAQVRSLQEAGVFLGEENTNNRQNSALTPYPRPGCPQLAQRGAEPAAR